MGVSHLLILEMDAWSHSGSLRGRMKHAWTDQFDMLTKMFYLFFISVFRSLNPEELLVSHAMNSDLVEYKTLLLTLPLGGISK